MPKVSPSLSNFSGGEFGPLLQGRSEIDRYRSALATCKNFIPTLQGPLVRRGGSKYVANTKNAGELSRLVSFEFSTTQAYIIEFGDQYVRFYRNQGQIISGTPVEVATPYLEAELFELQFTQSADVLYIVHPNHAPRKLTRTSHTAWTLTEVDYSGPYYRDTRLLASAAVITASATTGSINLTASASNTLTTADVGRKIRFYNGSGADFGEAQITGITGPTVATATVTETLNGTMTGAGTAIYAISLYYAGNYPATVTFHEDRLVFGATPDTPQRVDLSVTGDYENFEPRPFGSTTITADSAISFTLNANQVNVIRWTESMELGLSIGTVGGEWLVTPSINGEALEPSNVNAKKTGTFGSKNRQPIQVGRSVVYIERSGKKIRELIPSNDSLTSVDLTLLANHIAGEDGIKQVAYQREPHPVIWALREDGVLLSLTFEREGDSLTAGWARHIVGGTSDVHDTHAKVESVAVIPSEDGTTEETWISVLRYVNGGNVRHVEFIGNHFTQTAEQDEAWFVDCGLTLNSSISALISPNNPVYLFAVGHGLSDGDKVRIENAVGFEELYNTIYFVRNSSPNDFELEDEDGNAIDGTGMAAAASLGEVRKLVSTVSGLSHLEGETVQVLADGATQSDKTVSSGAITLDDDAATIIVGLGYNSDAQILRLDAGSADGTAMAKTRRIHRMGIMLDRSIGLKIGPDFSDLLELNFRDDSDSMTNPIPLFTGIRSEELEFDYDFENQFALRQDKPLPCTVLALFPQMVTQDR